MSAIARILHATDFSPGSAAAFAHALRIALDARARLYILHVESEPAADAWDSFPHVRTLLGRWGLMDPRKPPGAIRSELGIEVSKVSVRASDVRNAVARFAVEHECDLLVLWTHDRNGVRGWFGGSVAEDTARTAHLRTLFIPGDAAGFVDIDTGRSEIASVLAPVGDEFDSSRALREIEETLRTLAPHARPTLLHVGSNAPALAGAKVGLLDAPVTLRQGDVVATIVSVAKEIGASLIAMPTAGRRGMFEALRGSTTERVLREAGLPLLAVPVRHDG